MQGATMRLPAWVSGKPIRTRTVSNEAGTAARQKVAVPFKGDSHLFSPFQPLRPIDPLSTVRPS